MSVVVMQKVVCPKCGSENKKKSGFAKDHVRRMWQCAGCGRKFLEDPKRQRGKTKKLQPKEVVYIPKPKKCVECGEILSPYYRRKICASCLLKMAIFCCECGRQLPENNKSGICWNCKLEIIERAKQKQYVNLDVQYNEDGSPFCIDCGTLMVRYRGKWSCPNEACSIISLGGRGGVFKVVRDSILASQISGNPVILEVS